MTILEYEGTKKGTIESAGKKAKRKAVDIQRFINTKYKKRGIRHGLHVSFHLFSKNEPKSFTNLKPII